MIHGKKNDIAWCPDCGNFAIHDVLKKVLQELPVPTEKVVFTSGIGQAAKMPQYLDVNYFNGLHGRALPLAVGIKIARPDLTVIAYSGDGCNYGEGGNHFIQTMRKRLDITILTSNNQVYGLTKGQSSPTSDFGVKNSLTPQGTPNLPLNPVSLAISMNAPFVARGFAGDKEHLKGLIKEAILFKGTSLLDILQPCVSFNKINTYDWYRKMVFKIDKPFSDRNEALKVADLWDSKIPIGVIYRNDEVSCREDKFLFKAKITKDQIATQLNMKCVMMR